MKTKSRKAKYFTLSKYVDAALKKAEYEKDENGIILAKVPEAKGFFAQGDTFEDARENLQDVIEGNVILALQLGFKIPNIEGVDIKVIEYAKTETTQSPRSH
jgi:predicted RNase H-like HicB family nuclease